MAVEVRASHGEGRTRPTLRPLMPSMRCRTRPAGCGGLRHTDLVPRGLKLLGTMCPCPNPA
jgi:hypothetical protein